MSGVTLDRVLPTTLYKPQVSGPGEMMLFLRWSTISPPATLDLEDTWSSSDTPASVGYFVFFNQMPNAAQAAPVDKALREALPPDPEATGFTWVKYNPSKPVTDPQFIQVQFTIALKLNEAEAPAVSENVTVPLPVGMQGLGFAADAPVFSSTDADNKIDGFLVTYPPLPNAQLPTGVGISLPMTGAAVGCLRFDGLVNSAGPTGPSSVKKALVNVQIDPLRPFDATRTFQIFTGRAYLLSQDQYGYHIAPA